MVPPKPYTHFVPGIKTQPPNASQTISDPYLTHYKLANEGDHSHQLACVHNATCLTSMCVQSDKPTRMLFIYESSPR